jgi:hypothetical protein
MAPRLQNNGTTMARGRKYDDDDTKLYRVFTIVFFAVVFSLIINSFQRCFVLCVCRDGPNGTLWKSEENLLEQNISLVKRLFRACLTYFKKKKCK